MIERLVSGGQTGVDRAALDAAMAAGLPCGGWCPRGRRAEDGAIAARYQLKETRGRSYIERTRLNVRDSDATLVLAWGAPSGGTRATLEHARRTGKPHLVADLTAAGWADEPVRIGEWIEALPIRVLNVAGPRASASADVYGRARQVLDAVLSAAATR